MRRWERRWSMPYESLQRNPNNRFYVAPHVKITHDFKCAGFQALLQRIEDQVRH